MQIIFIWWSKILKFLPLTLSLTMKVNGVTLFCTQSIRKLQFTCELFSMYSDHQIILKRHYIWIMDVPLKQDKSCPAKDMLLLYYIWKNYQFFQSFLKQKCRPYSYQSSYWAWQLNSNLASDVVVLWLLACFIYYMFQNTNLDCSLTVCSNQYIGLLKNKVPLITQRSLRYSWIFNHLQDNEEQ